MANLGGLFLDKDIASEQRGLSSKASRLAGGKKTGAGIGGLLGALALSVVTGGAAAPLALAAAGGLGALAGSNIGGATSGVSQDDLLGGSFMKNTRGDVTKDIAKDEFSNVAKAAVSSFIGGMNPSSGVSKFGEGFAEGGGFGLDVSMMDPSHISEQGFGTRLLGGLKGGFSAVKPSFLSGDVTGDATNTDVPGLIGPLTNNTQSNYSFTSQLPGIGDADDWISMPDGRSWSETLGQYGDF